MKKLLSILLVLVLGSGIVFSQEEETKKVKDFPVFEEFGSGLLIDNQTSFKGQYAGNIIVNKSGDTEYFAE